MNVYDFEVKDIFGKTVSLCEYAGKVLLIINSATHCGFTAQYNDLEALYAAYRDAGFEILDFPCNQFGGQAPARRRRSPPSAAPASASPSRSLPKSTSTAPTPARCSPG